jgi:hypothetical protein
MAAATCHEISKQAKKVHRNRICDDALITTFMIKTKVLLVKKEGREQFVSFVPLCLVDLMEN